MNLPCVTNTTRECLVRATSLRQNMFGYGAETLGGEQGTPTRITSLNDSSLFMALTDAEPRYITFDRALRGQTWQVPAGSHRLGAFKTLDGRGSNITMQFGYPDNDLDINDPPVISPARTGQLVGTQGEFIMTGMILRGDLGWPYLYESPYFKNGATDGLEIWGGSNYYIYGNTFMRMSDESLGVFHNNGGAPDKITWANNRFVETKTGSLIGAPAAGSPQGRITVACNWYDEMVNGRSPGEVRHMDAHIFNNVINYVNDEGLRVGRGGRVISEYNVFDMGCNSGVSGPRVIRFVLGETPLGILHSSGDFIDPAAASCPSTRDQGFITPPAAPPFAVPDTEAYRKNRTLLMDAEQIRTYVDNTSGAQLFEGIEYCD